MLDVSYMSSSHSLMYKMITMGQWTDIYTQKGFTMKGRIKSVMNFYWLLGSRNLTYLSGSSHRCCWKVQNALGCCILVPSWLLIGRNYRWSSLGLRASNDGSLSCWNPLGCRAIPTDVVGKKKCFLGHIQGGF